MKSPLEAHFFKNGHNEDICPACHNKELTKQGRLIWLFLLIGIPIGYWIIHSISDNKFIGLLWLALWLVALQFIGLVLHEIAHWLAARLTGGICPIVAFGEGTNLFSWKTKHTIWNLNSSPTLGLAYCAYPPEKRQRWRSVIMLSAGFITNFIICCISTWIYFNGLDILTIESGSLLWLINALVNGWLFVASIYPHTIKTTLESDGLSIYKLFKSSGQKDNADDQNYQLIIASALLARENHNELKQFVKCCEGYQTSPLLLHLLSFAEYLDYNFEKFHKYAKKALKATLNKSSPENDQDKYIQAICKNNLAFAMYCLGSSEHKKMHKLSSEAFFYIPWEPSVAGTYATLLIRTESNIQEGIFILEKLEKEERKLKSQPTQRAMTYIVLSEGYQKLKQTKNSKSALLKAKELDSKLLALLNTNCEISDQT